MSWYNTVGYVSNPVSTYPRWEHVPIYGNPFVISVPMQTNVTYNPAYVHHISMGATNLPIPTDVQKPPVAHTQDYHISYFPVAPQPTAELAPIPDTPFHHYLAMKPEYRHFLFHPNLPPFPLPERNTQLYDAIGVQPGCDIDEVSKQFKKLALKYHPDKCNEDMAEEFKRFNYAKSILTDEEKKKEYDRFRDADRTCINLWVMAAAQIFSDGTEKIHQLVKKIHSEYLQQAKEKPETLTAEHREVAGSEVDFVAFEETGQNEEGTSSYEHEIDEDDVSSGPPAVQPSENPDSGSSLHSPAEGLNALWCSTGSIRAQLIQLSKEPMEDLLQEEQVLLQSLDQLKTMKEQLDAWEPSLELQMLSVHCVRLQDEVRQSLVSIGLRRSAERALSMEPRTPASHSVSPPRAMPEGSPESLFDQVFMSLASLANRSTEDSPLAVEESGDKHPSPARPPSPVDYHLPSIPENLTDAENISDQAATTNHHEELASIERAFKAVRMEVDFIVQQDISPLEKAEELQRCKDGLWSLIDELESVAQLVNFETVSLTLLRQMWITCAELDGEINEILLDMKATNSVKSTEPGSSAEGDAQHAEGAANQAQPSPEMSFFGNVG